MAPRGPSCRAAVGQRVGLLLHSASASARVGFPSSTTRKWSSVPVLLSTSKTGPAEAVVTSHAWGHKT
eukprot:7128987-Lingulodinium_polyedra.AAC.1